jgi:hypothetical protein
VQCHAAAGHTEVLSSIQDEAFVVHARFGECKVSGLVKPTDDVQALRAAFGEPSADNIEQLYSSFSERGLEYGPVFQVLKACSFGEAGAFARLGHVVPPWQSSFQLLHPALLDGALQLLVECASRGADSPATYLPFSVKRIVVASQCPPGELWASVKISDRAAQALTATVEIFNANGQLAVRLEDATCRRAEAAASGAADLSEQCLYSIEWAPIEAPVTALDGPVLLMAAKKEAELVKSVLSVNANDVTCVSELAKAVESIPTKDWAAIVVMPSTEGKEAVADAMDAACQLVNASSATGSNPPPVVLVTTGAQPPEVELKEHNPKLSGL